MSKLGKSIIVIAIVGALLAACAPKSVATPALIPLHINNPYTPQPGDGAMMGGEVEIPSVSILMTESLPPQVLVSLVYRLPTPCYQLRVDISQPDNPKHILLNLYGVAPNDKSCTLMALLTP